MHISINFRKLPCLFFLEEPNIVNAGEPAGSLTDDNSPEEASSESIDKKYGTHPVHSRPRPPSEAFYPIAEGLYPNPKPKPNRPHSPPRPEDGLISSSFPARPWKPEPVPEWPIPVPQTERPYPETDNRPPWRPPPQTNPEPWYPPRPENPQPQTRPPWRPPPTEPEPWYPNTPKPEGQPSQNRPPWYPPQTNPEPWYPNRPEPQPSIPQTRPPWLPPDNNYEPERPWKPYPEQPKPEPQPGKPQNRPPWLPPQEQSRLAKARTRTTLETTNY